MTNPFPQVTAEAFYRTARSALGRLACAYADPAAVEHPHHHVRECLTDDFAVSADLLLRLAACISSGDEDAMVDLLSHVNDSVQRPRS